VNPVLDGVKVTVDENCLVMCYGRVVTLFYAVSILGRSGDVPVEGDENLYECD
jgi:hypothetical protein